MTVSIQSRNAIAREATSGRRPNPQSGAYEFTPTRSSGKGFGSMGGRISPSTSLPFHALVRFGTVGVFHPLQRGRYVAFRAVRIAIRAPVIVQVVRSDAELHHIDITVSNGSGGGGGGAPRVQGSCDRVSQSSTEEGRMPADGWKRKTNVR
uniref:Uncharacterized protein n=1 Tax=Anopheles coluzzii TaxID=1518534 RepID=A0A8W7Q1A3_ANOCL